MSAKLGTPRPSGAAQRRRLHELLDSTSDRPLLWVSGPAGCGKSTLVASYLEARNTPAIWYDVDERDRDASSLFYFLARAVEPMIVTGAQPPPVPLMDDPQGLLGFSHWFFEELWRVIRTPTWLVFDNCQALGASTRWFELVQEGLTRIPDGVRVAFISRLRPPPRFSKLTAAGKVALVGWRDLQFSEAEAIPLIEARAARLGLALAVGQAQALAAESSGWVAGMMLGLERARHDGTTKSLFSPEGAQEIFDYFAAEVLERVERVARAAILKTAVLPHLTGAALEALLGRENGGRIFSRLQRDNFFVTRYTDGGTADEYRYHPLFRAFLWARLTEELDAQQVREAQRLAAAHFASRGDTETAIGLFLDAEAYGLAAELVVQQAPALLTQGRSQTLIDWSRRLPAPVAANPWLGFWVGMARLGNSPELAVEPLSASLAAFESLPDANGFWLNWCALMQAHLLSGHDHRDAIPLLEQYRERQALGAAFPSMEIEGRVLRTVVMAQALGVDGAFSPDVLERALALCTPGDPDELAVAGICYGFPGELRKLSAVTERWRRRVGRQKLPATTELALSLAEIFASLFSGEFAAALRGTRAAQQVAERAGCFAANPTVLSYASYIPMALGDRAALALAVDDLAALGGGRNINLANYQFAASREAMLAGDHPRARELAWQSVESSRRLGSHLAEQVHALGWIEALYRCGSLDKAHFELSQRTSDMARASRIIHAGALLLSAEMALGSGQARLADERLSQAFGLCEASGFVPVPWPRREALDALSARALSRGIEPAYVGLLRERFGFSNSHPSDASARRAVAIVDATSVAFSRAVREALRYLHEQRRLAKSPLLAAAIVRQRSGAELSRDAHVVALRAVLSDAVSSLARVERTEPLYRALHETYVEPAATQLLAAERARMSFGTYRRHLAAGLAEVSAALWLREQRLGAQPSNRAVPA